MNFKAWFESSNRHVISIKRDAFIHFTTLSRAKRILESGKLLMRPPYKKFGTDSVDAISIKYGQLVPGTQITHIKTDANDPVVAVWFRTNVLPYAAYPEEVKWNKDVPLFSAKIIQKEYAEKMLRPMSQDDYEIEYVN